MDVAIFRSFLGLFVALCPVFAQSRFSDYTNICSAKDPDLGNCLMKSGAQFLKTVEHGLPEYSIPSVNPFFVPKAELNASQLGLNVIFYNSTLYGLREIEFLSANVDTENYKISGRNRVPRLVIISTYTVSGKFMSLAVTGRGRSNITMIQTDVTWNMSGKPEMRDGVWYMLVKDLHIRADPRFMRLHFDNLFNGNRILGNTFNRLLNINWREMYQHIRPSIEMLYGEILFQIANNIFSANPINEIITDLL